MPPTSDRTDGMLAQRWLPVPAALLAAALLAVAPLVADSPKAHNERRRQAILDEMGRLDAEERAAPLNFDGPRAGHNASDQTGPLSRYCDRAPSGAKLPEPSQVVPGDIVQFCGLDGHWQLGFVTRTDAKHIRVRWDEAAEEDTPFAYPFAFTEGQLRLIGRASQWADGTPVKPEVPDAKQ